MVPLRKSYKLIFHDGSIRKKVLKYGTPKPRFAAQPAHQPKTGVAPALASCHGGAEPQLSWCMLGGASVAFGSRGVQHPLADSSAPDTAPDGLGFRV